MDCIYCTPEWLEESKKIYRGNPKYQEALKRLTISFFMHITAEPEWGIDPDMIFGALVTKGELDELRFFRLAEAKEKAEYIVTASPQEWKLILRKEHKFVADVMLKKIKIEKGSITGVVQVAPYSGAFVDALTQVNLIFQDELSPQQLNDYREYAAQFRPRLGI